MTFQYFFFDTYIGYFLQALPFALLISTAYGIIRYRKNKSTSLLKKVFSCVFVCYMTGLICLVIGLDAMGIFWFKLFYHMDPGRTIQWFSGEFDLIPDFFRHINSEVIGNFLMFVPFGILYPLSKEKTFWKNTVLVGLVSVLVIEIFQPIFGRAFDLNDVILNFVGIMVGYAMFVVIKALYDKSKIES